MFSIFQEESRCTPRVVRPWPGTRSVSSAPCAASNSRWTMSSSATSSSASPATSRPASTGDRAGGENICSSTKIFAVCQVRGVRRLHHGRGLQLPRAVLARQLLRLRRMRRGVPRRQVPRAQRGEALWYLLQICHTLPVIMHYIHSSLHVTCNITNLSNIWNNILYI